MKINKNKLLLSEIFIDSLGTIYSPLVKDIIGLSEKEYENILSPFLITLDNFCEVDKGTLQEIEDTIKRKFTLFDYLSSDKRMCESILNSLKFFYKTENIYVYQDYYEKKFLVNCSLEKDKYSPKENTVIISYHNWDILCDIIKKLMLISDKKIEKREVVLENEANRGILEEYLRLQKQKEEEQRKLLEKNSISIHDMIIIVASECLWDYDKVLNMTYYRFAYAYKTIMGKDNYKTNILYNISPKYDTGDMKIEHWTNSIKKSE